MQTVANGILFLIVVAVYVWMTYNLIQERKDEK